MSSKWNRAYWEDLGERVGSSAVGGALTALTVNGTTSVHVTTKIVETLILVPSAVALLKGLLVNLGGGGTSGSASVVGTSSTKKRG